MEVYIYGSKSNLEHFEAIEDENKRLAISGASTLKQRPFLITRYLASPVRHKIRYRMKERPDYPASLISYEEIIRKIVFLSNVKLS